MDVFNRYDCGVSVVLPTRMPYQWEDTIIVGKPLREKRNVILENAEGSVGHC